MIWPTWCCHAYVTRFWRTDTVRLGTVKNEALIGELFSMIKFYVSFAFSLLVAGASFVVALGQSPAEVPSPQLATHQD